MLGILVILLVSMLGTSCADCSISSKEKYLIILSAELNACKLDYKKLANTMLVSMLLPVGLLKTGLCRRLHLANNTMSILCYLLFHQSHLAQEL